MSRDLETLTGARLAGRYRLVRQLGVGGMGVVYEAVQEDLDRRVAVKILTEVSPSDLARFEVEARVMAQLGNPHIVQISDFCVAPGDPPFLVMELLSGRSLRQLLVEEGLIGWERAAHVGLQVLDALAAAHAAKIVHRDIKPENLFIVSSSAIADMIKVLDFGVAKRLEAGTGGPMTHPGALIGTIAYMAPEQTIGGVVDARTDLYALGVCLYESVSGRRPFAGADIASFLRAIGRDEPTPLERYCPQLPPAFLAVVSRAIRRAPEARFQSATEMATALAESLGLPARAPAHTAMSAPRSAMADSATFRGDAAQATAVATVGPSPASPTELMTRRLSGPAPVPHASSSAPFPSSGSLPSSHPLPFPSSGRLPPSGPLPVSVSPPRRSTWWIGVVVAVVALAGVVVVIGGLLVAFLLVRADEPPPKATPSPTTAPSPAPRPTGAPTNATPPTALRNITVEALRARAIAAGFEIFLEDSSKSETEQVNTLHLRRGPKSGAITLYRYAGPVASALADVNEEACRKTKDGAHARDGSTVLLVVLSPSGAQELLDSLRR